MNTKFDIHESQTENNGSKKKPRGRPFKKGNKFGCASKKDKKKASISDYILKKTNNGKLMADFYIGVLKTINANTEGKKMVYNGVPITVELAKSANDWLTNNCFGKPSARDKPAIEEPEMSREELDAEIKRMINEAGLKLVDINSPSPKQSF